MEIIASILPVTAVVCSTAVVIVVFSTAGAVVVFSTTVVVSGGAVVVISVDVNNTLSVLLMERANFLCVVPFLCVLNLDSFVQYT